MNFPSKTKRPGAALPAPGAGRASSTSCATARLRTSIYTPTVKPVKAEHTHECPIQKAREHEPKSVGNVPGFRTGQHSGLNVCWLDVWVAALAQEKRLLRLLQRASIL
jgi:hypothetical protein